MSKQDAELVDPIHENESFGPLDGSIAAAHTDVGSSLFTNTVQVHVPPIVDSNSNAATATATATLVVSESQDQVVLSDEENTLRLKSLSLDDTDHDENRLHLDPLQEEATKDGTNDLRNVLQPSPPPHDDTSSHSMMNSNEHVVDTKLPAHSKDEETTSNNEEVHHQPLHAIVQTKKVESSSDIDAENSNQNNDIKRESNNNNNAHDDEEFAILLAKRNSLLQNLKILQTKRNRIKAQSSTVSLTIKSLHQKLNHVQISRDAKIQTYTSLHQSNVQKQQLLKRLQQTNVLQDCFWISTRGEVGGGDVYATINGLRLGLELPPTFDVPSVSTDSSGMGINFEFLWGNAGGDNATANSSNFSSSVGGTLTKKSVQQSTTSAPVPPPPVSWPEVNAALGTLALCLHVIHERIVGPLEARYVIQPRGSTSRISSVVGPGGSGSKSTPGLGGNNGETFELFYNPVRFSFFTRRNFNTALGMLGYCLWEVGQVFTKMSMDEKEKMDHIIETQGQNANRNEVNSNGVDQMWSFPYQIVVAQEGSVVNGGVTVGGMELSYTGDGVLWTKAMRYFALNIKWCMAFMAKKNLDV